MEAPIPDIPDDDERARRTLAYAVLRGIVHDLNNPLASVTMAIAALRTIDDPVQRSELLDLTEQAALRAGAVAHDAALRYAPTDAAATAGTLHALATEVQRRCDDRGLEVAVSLPAPAGNGPGVGEPAAVGVRMDAALLPAALVALAADAHDAPGRSRPVTLAFDVVDDALLVRLHDDGEAPAEAVQRRPFVPVGPDGDEHGRGVGLAVAAARAHLVAVGGAVDLRHTDAGETVLTVRIPEVVTGAGASTAAAGEAEETAADGAGATGRRALVVDDDETLCTLLAMVLERTGWRVHVAADGEQAERVVAAQPVELVLLDVHLERELGPEVAARLDRLRPGLLETVVYLTGDPPRDGMLEGRPTLAKPFDLAELDRVVRRTGAAEG
ncbi:ATP-binding response regulator [Egicoccus halophilus]|uniref:Histidine kinase-, DNA gyrase B-, and HSP90-like ATPase n=1 Tax=Egicoccus halophilus TaxID=1670830 RepID=A0A8J3EVG8_9ACTN|nr:response regulator [Egicoccus halophilus]GGI08102.1 hypothetical protein GCM10011354_27420 [Egicoccus halophilus]